MHISRLEILVQAVANEPKELSKEELFSRVKSMGIKSETIKEIEDALWDLYIILRGRTHVK